MRRVFDGLGIFLGVAGVFLFLGLLAFLLEVQSPSFVQWNGIKVHGITERGLTYYTYDGQKFAVDNRFARADDTRRLPTTVWLSKSDPTDDTKAYIDNAYNRWLDFGLVVVWFVIAAAIVVGGLIRRHMHRRRRIITMGTFGAGISDEAVRRYLARQRDHGGDVS